MFAQSIFRRFSVFRHAARIDHEVEAADADLLKKLRQGQNTLGVKSGSDASGVFHADLMELAAAPCGGFFPAEHRADVEYTGFHTVHCIGSGKGAHHARGSLGAERKTASAAILESVHFLLHDFRFVSESALKHFRIFKNGGADLSIPVKAEYTACGVFDGEPRIYLIRENIACSRRRSRNLGHDTIFLYFWVNNFRC